MRHYYGPVGRVCYSRFPRNIPPMDPRPLRRAFSFLSLPVGEVKRPQPTTASQRAMASMTFSLCSVEVTPLSHARSAPAFPML